MPTAASSRTSASATRRARFTPDFLRSRGRSRRATGGAAYGPGVLEGRGAGQGGGVGLGRTQGARRRLVLLGVGVVRDQLRAGHREGLRRRRVLAARAC